MRVRACLALGLAASASVIGASSAAAASPAPAWSIAVAAAPSDFTSADNSECLSPAAGEGWESCENYVVTATNIGGKATNGSAVTLTDTLPSGLKFRGVSLFWVRFPAGLGTDLQNAGASCVVNLPAIHCTLPASFFANQPEPRRHVLPDEVLKMFVSVTVQEPQSPAALVDAASVSGGGVAGEVSAIAHNTLATGVPSFGLASFTVALLGADGQPATQAGAHPYELTTSFVLNSTRRLGPEAFLIWADSVADPRDVLVDLPPGLAGSAVSAPRCTLARLASKGEKDLQGQSGCPTDTIVGHIRSYPESGIAASGPLYNLIPERGYAAELGFIDGVGGTHVLQIGLAPTPAGYVLRTTAREIPQVALQEITANVFGDPAARDKSAGPHVPTFTNPAACTGQPLTTSIHLDSWQAPGSYKQDGTPNLTDPNWVTTTFESPPVTGCETLEGLFNPSIEATPESTSADSPTGLQVNLSVPQQEGVETLGTPPLKDAVVTLPEGMTVNPSSANGLGACSEAQVGISATGVPDAARPACPDSSKLGTVEVDTPALPAEACREPTKTLEECPEASERQKTPLHGAIYLARQGENPFGSLVAIYIVIDDPRTGVVVKIPARVDLDPVTGRLTTTVPNAPQFPFSQLRTHFFGGSTAALRTPAMCGGYSVTSVLTPWSAPESGPPATASSGFEVALGAGGGACPPSADEQPNAPSFHAGTVNATAGAFSPLVVHLGRDDGSQNFGVVSVTLPPGATGRLAGIPQCSDGQIAVAQGRGQPGEGALEAASPSCAAASQIGTVTVGAGAGPNPFYVTGKAYLAGPYKGAPFSAVFITPAVAGPFDLGVVVVRAGLYINPNTAQVTTRSDALPTILQGIPLDIRSLTVNVDRPQFTLNPTNCTPMSVSGEEVSTLGHVAPLSARFQVGDCASLPFHPKLTASVAGKASKANGTAFAVNVTSAGLGQANIAKVELQLPKALPSRLSTLQKACLAAVFDVNPAACGEGSVIGTAKIRTPLLASPLSGPAYLVSHGNAAFPDVEFVLQGEGVTLILDGKTDIKKGITYSRFETAPDAPFTTFETVLPAGPHSALGANGPEKERFNLCNTSLAMPTQITAQSGAVIRQTTKVAPNGCPKGKALTRPQKLAAALKACSKKANHKKRAACIKQAHRKYGPRSAKKRSKNK